MQRLVLTALLGLGLLAAGQTGAAAAPPHPAGQPVSGPMQYSTVWAGFVAVDNVYTAANAHWIQPAITCPAVPSPATALFAAGLDGWADGALEQAGVDASCVNGIAAYHAFTQTVPDAVADGFSVLPGDTMAAEVIFQVSGRFVLKVVDDSSGETLRVVAPCPSGTLCSRTSAEVLVEAPQASDGSETILPAFAPFRFDSVKTSVGDNGYDLVPIADDMNNPVTMLGSDNTERATPGSLGDAGAGFLATWYDGA